MDDFLNNLFSQNRALKEDRLAKKMRVIVEDSAQSSTLKREMLSEVSAPLRGAEKQDIYTLKKTDEDFKKHQSGLTDLIPDVSITFGDFVVNRKTNTITWEGKIEGHVEWKYIYNGSSLDGVYLTCSDIKMEFSLVSALNKLSIYYQKTWFKDMQDLLNNDKI